MDLNRIFAEAITRKDFKVYTYNFLNELTMLPTNMKVTGIGLASVEFGDADSSGFECIILLDNKQIYYYTEDSLKHTGRYVICDDLTQISEHDPQIGLIETAQDTIKYYPN